MNSLKTPTKKYVIGGNAAQARAFIVYKCIESDLSPSDFSVVMDVNSLRGIRSIHGYLIGTWRTRPDIKELIELIILSEENYVNTTLERILREL